MKQVVMVVDDEKRVLEYVEYILKKNGFNCECFNRSTVALRAFHAAPGRYTHLITDIYLPGDLDGKTLARMITEARDIPVLFYTGLTDIWNIKYLENFGEYLGKTAHHLEAVNTICSFLFNN